MKDYYKILGVNNSVNNTELKKKFVEKIQKYSNPGIKEDFSDSDIQNIKELREAYFVLEDYIRRRNYDIMLFDSKKKYNNQKSNSSNSSNS